MRRRPVHSTLAYFLSVALTDWSLTSLSSSLPESNSQRLWLTCHTFTIVRVLYNMPSNEYPPARMVAKGHTAEEEVSDFSMTRATPCFASRDFWLVWQILVLTTQQNIQTAKEYMSIAYSPKANTGAESVSHLCHPDSWFWAPSTFPGCETPMDYAQSHSVVMKSVSDLRILRFDQVFAKGSHVLLRYTAEGSHCGEPYKGIEKTGRKATWSAAAIFEVEDGKIRSFTKDWDQKTMQVGRVGSHSG